MTTPNSPSTSAATTAVTANTTIEPTTEQQELGPPPNHSDLYASLLSNLRPLRNLLSESVGRNELQVLRAVEDDQSLRLLLPVLLDGIRIHSLQARQLNHTFSLLCEIGLAEKLQPLVDAGVQEGSQRLARPPSPIIPAQEQNTNDDTSREEHERRRNAAIAEAFREIVRPLYQDLRGSLSGRDREPSQSTHRPVSHSLRRPTTYLPGRMASRGRGAPTHGGTSQIPRRSRTNPNAIPVNESLPTFQQSVRRVYPSYMRNFRCFVCEQPGHFREWCPHFQCPICNLYAPQHSQSHCPRRARSRPSSTIPPHSTVRLRRLSANSSDGDRYGAFDFDDEAYHNMDT